MIDEETIGRVWREQAEREGHFKCLPDNRGWVTRDEAVERRGHLIVGILNNGPMRMSEAIVASGLTEFPFKQALEYAVDNLGVNKRRDGRIVILELTGPNK